ncbi:conserved hypothetical protein [Flavobacterium sp. 9AF]|uniref:hypothetical protein n=1 Tax=Flavobacterium sp. 9AF TaxID=2653142 RepID=UPI0012F08880|nr:hypothetical protein [Flavobacterium sp. 9AF]VXB93584.1 conserved hypothetical protein [Flavobacterium sp. 9AF]
MKKGITLFLLLGFFLPFAQSKLKPGLYVSKNEQKGIELRINEDETYELTILSGKFQAVNDTIVLNSKYASMNPFEITKTLSDERSNFIDVSFNYSYYSYYGASFFIGTQNNDKDAVEYKNLLDYISDNENYYDLDKKVNFKVKKTKYLYFVVKQKDFIKSSKYLIDENISTLDVLYSGSNFASLQLKAYKKDENSIVVTEGKQPLLFELDGANVKLDDKSLQPIVFITDAKIDLPIREEEFVSEEQTYLENTEENKKFVFKHTINQNFKDALATLNKTPSKFLVVARNFTKEDFNAYIKKDEEELSSYMYYDYLPEYDKYNYYLATEKDDKLFPSASKEKQLYFLNTNGQILYFTNGDFEENNQLLQTYSYSIEELNKVNSFALLDYSLQNKKTALPTYKDVFAKIVEIEVPYEYDYSTVEELKSQDIEETEDAVVVVDTAVVEVVEAVDSYSELKDRQNLYLLKATKETVFSKWSEVLEFYNKQSSFDKEIVKIIKKELSNEGFSKTLFDEKGEIILSHNFKGLDYLLKYYEQIKKDEDTPDENYYYSKSMNEAMVSFLKEIINSENNFSKQAKQKAINYFDKYVEVSNNNSQVISAYLDVLGENNNLQSKEEYYKIFELYLSVLFPSTGNQNIFEALDKAYVENNENDWSIFKYSFSNLSNNVAWTVVQNDSTDSVLIKKAIKWSELSNEVTKNNGYFLDTLAQLYYKDGQKQKAIKTEEEAIKVMNNLGEYGSDSLMEMEIVLKKMKEN